MPRLQGPHIFEEDGSCRECGGPQADHRPIACGYPRKDYTGRTPCEGICMYKKQDDGLLTCCSVCPRCGIPPIDDPNDAARQNGNGLNVPEEAGNGNGKAEITDPEEPAAEHAQGEVSE